MEGVFEDVLSELQTYYDEDHQFPRDTIRMKDMQTFVEEVERSASQVMNLVQSIKAKLELESKKSEFELALQPPSLEETLANEGPFYDVPLNSPPALPSPVVLSEQVKGVVKYVLNPNPSHRRHQSCPTCVFCGEGIISGPTERCAAKQHLVHQRCAQEWRSTAVQKLWRAGQSAATSDISGCPACQRAEQSKLSWLSKLRH